MTPIIVIGATLAAFQFCSIIQQNPDFNCVVLDSNSHPSEQLQKISQPQTLDLYTADQLRGYFDAPLRSSKGHFFNENVVEILKEVSKSVLAKTEDLNYNGTVGDLLLEKLSDNVVHGRDFLNLLSRQQCYQNCDTSLFEILYKDFPGLSESNTDSIKNTVDSHDVYQSFLEKVTFNKRVTSIDYRDDDVTVECSDGSQYTAPFALITLPLGVLKRSYKSIFTLPPLPQQKVNAIQGFCTTSTNEITLEFASSLPKSNLSRNFLWLGPDFKAVESTDNKWLLGIPGLYSHPVYDNQLIGFNTGVYSKAMESVSSDDLKKGFEFLLKKFYTDQVPLRARGVKPQVNINLPALLNVRISQINSDPMTLGGSTFQCTSAKIFEATYDDLAASVFNFKGVPKVFFALEGEIESGRREAERLTSYITSPDDFNRDPKNRQRSFSSVQLADQVDVLVLGAGTAGVAAARNLKANSTLSFLVLEAFNQHGGRIRTVPMVNVAPGLGTVNANAGAQWLHAKSNPMYDFAVENDLILLPDSDEAAGKFYRDDGYIFDEEFAEEVGEIVDAILTDAQRFYTEEIFPYPANMEVFVREEFEKYIVHFPQEDKIRARQLLRWHELFQVIDWSAPEFSALSAKSWGRFQLVDDSWEYVNLKEGLWGLLRDMINEVGPQYFLYNKRVTEIQWGRGFDLGEDQEVSKVLVKTADGTIYAANFVIPTFSLGVLKRDVNSMFIPALPSRHRQFINCFGFFSISKIFLEFPDQWYGDELGFHLVFSEETRTNWKSWVNGFDIVYTGHENTLLGWVGGLGLYQMEALTDEEIISGVMQDLRSRFLVKSNLTVPDPIRYYVSRWLTNPLTLGCYSYASAACDASGLGPDDLFEPIGLSSLQNDGRKIDNTDTPIILFAGEAASDQYYSCAHGAYFTGAEQAQTVINYSDTANSMYGLSKLTVAMSVLNRFFYHLV